MAGLEIDWLVTQRARSLSHGVTSYHDWVTWHPVVILNDALLCCGPKVVCVTERSLAVAVPQV